MARLVTDGCSFEEPLDGRPSGTMCWRTAVNTCTVCGQDFCARHCATDGPCVVCATTPPTAPDPQLVERCARELRALLNVVTVDPIRRDPLEAPYLMRMLRGEVAEPVRLCGAYFLVTPTRDDLEAARGRSSEHASEAAIALTAHADAQDRYLTSADEVRGCLVGLALYEDYWFNGQLAHIRAGRIANEAQGLVHRVAVLVGGTPPAGGHHLLIEHLAPLAVQRRAPNVERATLLAAFDAVLKALVGE